MFDRLRLFFAKGTQGVEEIGLDFHQWRVAGLQALLFLVLVFRLTCSRRTSGFFTPLGAKASLASHDSRVLIIELYRPHYPHTENSGFS